MRLKRLSIVAVFGLTVPLFVACGSDDNGDGTKAATSPPTATQTTQPPAATSPDTATETTQPSAATRAPTIRMTEYAFDPRDVVVKAGKVTISAPNDGQTVHELVVLKTATDPAKLPKKGGKVDESTSVGEIADVAPGATKKTTVNLTPGKYAMVCALPGHYEAGMYGTLTAQ